jgi:hypothetical protein
MAKNDDEGEHLKWTTPRGNYSLVIEAWNDESRFQVATANGQAVVDTLVCRATVPITDPIRHPMPGSRPDEVSSHIQLHTSIPVLDWSKYASNLSLAVV